MFILLREFIFLDTGYWIKLTVHVSWMYFVCGGRDCVYVCANKKWHSPKWKGRYLCNPTHTLRTRAHTHTHTHTLPLQKSSELQHDPWQCFLIQRHWHATGVKCEFRIIWSFVCMCVLFLSPVSDRKAPGGRSRNDYQLEEGQLVLAKVNKIHPQEWGEGVFKENQIFTKDFGQTELNITEKHVNVQPTSICMMRFDRVLGWCTNCRRLKSAPTLLCYTSRVRFNDTV